MRGSRDICCTIIRGLVTGHVMTCSGAVDSTQAATSLPDLTVGRRKDLQMRYPRDQCKLASDRLPIRDTARGRNSLAVLAHQHVHKRMDGGHHPGTTRQARLQHEDASCNKVGREAAAHTGPRTRYRHLVRQVSR